LPHATVVGWRVSNSIGLSMPRELWRRWRTRLEPANAIFDYLEIFHNRQRRHSSLGMLSPIEFETRQPTTVA